MVVGLLRGRVLRLVEGWAWLGVLGCLCRGRVVRFAMILGRRVATRTRTGLARELERSWSTARRPHDLGATEVSVGRW